METMMKSSSGISLIPVESRLLAERKLFLEGEIDMAMACGFLRAAMLLEQESTDMPVDIYICSPGGLVSAGLLIYDTIKGMRSEVNLHCTGLAASMAAILLASGKKGHRFILPHSKVMIHEPLISGGMGGSAISVKRAAESIMETKRITVELLARDTKRTEEEVEAALSFDNYMNAREAIDFGLCDSIETTIV